MNQLDKIKNDLGLNLKRIRKFIENNPIEPEVIKTRDLIREASSILTDFIEINKNKK